MMENKLNRGIIQRLWYFFTSVQLAIILLALLAMDLCYAYFYVNDHTTIFEAMNREGLWPWLSTFGIQNFHLTSWFFILLLLLFFLAINSMVCTWHRLILLYRKWKVQGLGTHIALSIFIHMMHIGIVVTLVGYLISYTMTQVYPSITLVPEKKQTVATIPLTLTLLSMDLPVYEGKRLEAFSGRILRPQARIQLVLGHDTRIASLGFNKPIRFYGYTLFLQRFSPQQKSSISSRHYLVLDVRRDPGVSLYFIGITCFIVGFFGYILLGKNFNRPKGTL